VLNFLLWLLSSVTGFEHFVGLQIATYLVVCLVGMNSEMTPEGQRITKLEQILLNGNNIAIVSVWCFSCCYCLNNLLNLLLSLPEVKKVFCYRVLT
jgi:CBS domain containing-hemolysin-like protein